MTIPGRGDLSPRRDYGYGRRRRRWPRLLLVLVVLAAIAAGGYYGWHRWRDTGTATVALAPCPTPMVTPSSTSSPTVSARVLNGSLKSGLAATVAKQLRQRFGVVVTKVGNAPRFTHGASVVRYPVRLLAQARELAGFVVPHARLHTDAGLPRVELDIGTAFRSVASVVEHTTPPISSPTPCASS